MADIKIGNLDISAFKVGSGDCSVYLGSIQLYPQDTPVTSPKWIATYSDSSTSSAECDSTSAISQNEITKANLISVEIGDCVTNIGDSAFQYCTVLSNVAIGSGVTTIGSQSFAHCGGLTSINIPNSVTSIGNSAFYNCASLTSITISDSVTSINGSTFSNCSGLSSITIPDSVTSIANSAFSNCSGLTDVTIGSGVTSIGASFYNCSSLTSITIPDSVTSIGSAAFMNCSSLTSITVNATTPATLGSMAFDNTNDCPIYVPAASVDTYKTAWSDYASRIQAMPTPAVKWIATYSDSSTSSAECDSTSSITNGDIEKTNLISVEIGDCVSAIVGECFSDCSKLSAATINGYTSIDNYSFARNNGTLKTIIMLSPTPPPCANTAFTYYNHGYVPMTSITIYVPAESVEAYKAASGWSRYADKIQAIANT